jgi:predicted AlkP superfamily phosphohydrolase/phosphomutase
MAASLVAIDLNGIKPALVERWCDQGRLPVLAHLRRAGVCTPLTSRARLFPFSVATELNTGQSVLQTGLFVQSNQLYGADANRLERYQRLGERQYWNVASQAGVRAAVIDPLLAVPWSAPDRRETRGAVELLGWSLHDRTPFGTTSRPAELLAEVRRDYGEPRLGFDDPLHHCNRVPKAELAQVLRTSAARKGRLLVDLLRRRDVDFLTAAFSEAHCGGHQLWHAPDELRTVYESLDEQIGRILEAAGPRAGVLVIGTDAVGPPFGNGPLFLPHVLHRLDRAATGGWRRKASRGRAGSLLRPIVPRVAKRALLPAVAREPRAFPVFNGFNGAVRLNLAGREANGIVHPGTEARAVMEDMTGALLDLRLCGTDTPVVEDVVVMADACGDAFSSELPDAVVVFRKDLGDYECVESDRMGRIHLETVRGATVTGENTGECHLWSSGLDGFDPGAASQPDILDIAPTILALLGIDVPAWMNGRALSSLPCARATDPGATSSTAPFPEIAKRSS